MEYNAGQNVKQLGLCFSTLPPDSLIIKRVREGTWAEAHGLEAGDMVVAVNGLDVHQLTGDKFKFLMRERPLTLLVDSLTVGQEDGEFTPQSTRSRSTVFDPDMWWWESEDVVDDEVSSRIDDRRPQQRIPEVQEEVCSNGFRRPSFAMVPHDKYRLPCKDVSLTQEMSPDEAEFVFNTDQDTEEGADSFLEGADSVIDNDTDDAADIILHADDMMRARSTEYVVGPEVTRLGLAFSTLPPDPLIVKRVAAGTWADLQGVRAGDMIVTVNGLDVDKLTSEEFKCIVQERPLALRIDSLMEDLPCPACSRTTVFDTDS